MTHPATARPGIADGGIPPRDKPERSRAELLRLLRNEDCVAAPRPYPTPRFFPDRPPPGSEHAAASLHRSEEPAPVRQGSKRPRSTPAAAAARRRKAHNSARSLWLATTVMLGVAVMAGAGLIYIATTGRDLPGTAQLVLAGDTLAALWPDTGAAEKADAAGRVQATSAHKTALAAPVSKPVVTAAVKIAPASDVASGSGAAIFTQGLESMLAGDVKAARALYRRAIEHGEARAIAHLGRSYDPLVLARLKSSNAAANRERAIAWYRRAIEAGDTSVKPDMAALEQQQTP